MSARPIASATISFGLVSIPCHLYSSGVTSRKVSFNLLSPEGKRVKQQYVEPQTGEVFERKELVKGYQFAKDKYVTFTPEELKALEARATQAIDIVEFVPVEKVDRAYIEKTYYMGPGRGGDKAYRLLWAAMEKTGWAALAKYAARGKQYLVLVRPLGEHLVLEQLHYARDMRKIADVPMGAAVPSDAEIKLAVQLIEQIASEDFRPNRYEDEVGERMLAEIEKKVADGAEIEAPEEEHDAKVIDLMAALRKSVAESDAPAKKSVKAKKSSPVKKAAPAKKTAKAGKAAPRTAAATKTASKKAAPRKAAPAKAAPRKRATGT